MASPIAEPQVDADGHYERYASDYVRRLPDGQHPGLGGREDAYIADWDREYERHARHNPVQFHMMSRDGRRIERTVELDLRRFSPETIKYAVDLARESTGRSATPGAQKARAMLTVDTLKELESMQPQPQYGYAGGYPGASYPPGPPPGPQPSYVQPQAPQPSQAPGAYQVVPQPQPHPAWQPAPSAGPPPGWAGGPAPQAPARPQSPAIQRVTFFLPGAGQFAAPYHYVDVQAGAHGEPCAVYLTVDNAAAAGMTYLPDTIEKGVVLLPGSPVFLHVVGLGLRASLKDPARGLDLTTVILMVSGTEPVGGGADGEAR